MRAREPDRRVVVRRDGVDLACEVYGEEHSTNLLLLPAWSIVNSRHWKAQIPVLSAHHRVIVCDGRGNGASDRPAGAAAYLPDEYFEDAVAVLDATQTSRAVIAGVSFGAFIALLLAARLPERVAGACFIGATVPFLEDGVPPLLLADFEVDKDAYADWESHNRHAWRKDYEGFLKFFFSKCFPEDHSTKPVEDCVSWGLETNAERLADTVDGRNDGIAPLLGKGIEQLCAAIQCPTMHIHGTEDEILSPCLGGTSRRRPRE